MKYHAAIQMQDGRRMPVFAGRKSVAFTNIEKAVKGIEKHALARTAKTVSGMRGLVWPTGKTFAETEWKNIYTLAL